MKKVFLFLFCFSLLGTVVMAQTLPKVSKEDIPTDKKDVESMGNIGDMLGQFATEGLDQDAVVDGFNPTDFANSVKGVSDISQIGKHISNLTSVVKPEMWKDGVDVQKLTDAGNSAVTLADATGLLGNIQDSLVGKAFQKGWDASKFAGALNLLK